MKTLLNYLGQLRLYSLADLAVLLIATGARPEDFLGIIFLHIGFLAFLETKHSHSYRNKVPKWLWLFLTIIGIGLYRHWEVIGFLVFSYLYTKKNTKYFGYFSSFSRGFQYFFLVAGVVGYASPLTWITLVLVSLRNFMGDLRDVIKDKNEGMKTLPIMIGFNSGFRHIHLISLLFTSFVWWTFTSLPLWSLLPIFMIEIFTYSFTSR